MEAYTIDSLISVIRHGSPDSHLEARQEMGRRLRLDTTPSIETCYEVDRLCRLEHSAGAKEVADSRPARRCTRCGHHDRPQAFKLFGM